MEPVRCSEDFNNHLDLPIERKSWKRGVSFNTCVGPKTGYVKGSFGIYKQKAGTWWLVDLPTGQIISPPSSTMKQLKAAARSLVRDSRFKVLIDEAGWTNVESFSANTRIPKHVVDKARSS